MHALVPLSAEDKLAIAALPYPVSAAEEKRVRMVRACKILDTSTDDAGYNSTTQLAIRKLKVSSLEANECSFISYFYSATSHSTDEPVLIQHH